MRTNTFHPTAARGHLRKFIHGFTLVEILVVIGVIGILAALILPAVAQGLERARVSKARIEIAQIALGIERYQSTYSRPPGAGPGGADATYGGPALGSVLGPGTWTASHSDIIAILMDIERDGLGNPTVNDKHVKNPRRERFLPASRVSSVGEPGVGPDLIYRDPWGVPYVISMDLNYDGKCSDAFFNRRAVSQQTGPTGFDGLHNTVDPGGAGDNFLFHGTAMVWSFGPNTRADKDRPANAGVNKDNVRSWR